MSPSEEKFLQELRATFKIEAGEHLQAIANGLIGMEKAASAEEQYRCIETIFRAAHSLKGAARAVNFGQIESICQSLEDLFATWKRREAVPDAASLDTAHRALDATSLALVAPPEPPESSTHQPVSPARSLSIESAPAFVAHASASSASSAPESTS